MKRIAATVLLILVACVAFSPPTWAKDAGVFKVTPTKHGDRKWRIAYYEGGEYTDYQKIFIETVRGLMKLGWIETTDIPPQKGEQTKDLWPGSART